MGLTESMKAAAAADSDRAPASSRDHSREADGWLTGTLIAIFVVVCCAGPLLIGALAAAGAGAWLATHGYAIGATALLVVAAAFAWRIRARLSRG